MQDLMIKNKKSKKFDEITDSAVRDSVYEYFYFGKGK